jgi:hypothetical protein
MERVKAFILKISQGEIGMAITATTAGMPD